MIIKNEIKCYGLCFVVLPLLLISGHAFAIGSVIGRIAEPAIEKGELEFEYELLILYDRPELNNTQRHRFSFEKAVSDQWAIELGGTANRGVEESLHINEYEVEVKYLFKGQDNYALLFELERDTDEQSWEVTSSLLIQHEWRNWTGVANLGLIYEKSDEGEVETNAELAVQIKHDSFLHPAIEYYRGENIDTIGPGIGGEFALFDDQKISWQLGTGFSLKKKRTDRLVRFYMEYEF